MRELDNATNLAIFCSFGKDSLLVLRMALQVGFSGPCYYFGERLSNLAQQVIIDNDLMVYSWPATNRYVVPDGEGWAQVDEYLIGERLLPFLTPITRGDKCQHMQFTRRHTRPFHYPHDVTLTGYKQSDQVLGMTLPREFDLGVTRIVNPLYEWTDDEVIEALGFKPPDETIEYCDECFAVIEQMDREASLATFRQRFNLN